MADAAKSRKIVVGAKQTLKSLETDSLSDILIADDADAYVTREIRTIAAEKGIPITIIESMKKLGKECGIEVGAAVAGVVK